MELCLETRYNIQDLILYSSMGLDLMTCDDLLFCEPEGKITQFSDMSEGNSYSNGGTDVSDISSCCTEAYQQGFLNSEDANNFMDFALDFEDPILAEPVELLETPQVILPWQILDEAESSRFTVENLLKAWAEALEREAWELLKVISNRLQRRVSVTGTHWERAAYYFVNSLSPPEAPGRAGHRLMEEICKEASATAFQALYELFPYARFAHFTANQSILECFASSNSRKIHIVDFDVREGLQWPSLMEALAAQSGKRSLQLLRITAVKWEDDAGVGFKAARATPRRLSGAAAALGIPFLYEEIRLQDLRQRLLWEEPDFCLVFNMMLDLPHMPCQRSEEEALKFLSLTRHLPLPPAILTSASPVIHNGHVIDTVDYFCAMLESLEFGLPGEGLAMATRVMEHIFIAPKIRSRVSSSHGKGLMEDKLRQLPSQCGFSDAGIETSEEKMAQAWEVVGLNRGSQNYTVENYKNEIILKWRNRPLVSSSAWRCFV
ncbi:protein NODULATION SIGNALING PATHWAY 2 [Cryptomeria japonica]|uniref:protein NODULATION SIGNALING PATHWAY 2 n=1 Tax=Cryptomeria japonica TaxID=3369 RepID=UPI0025AB90D8|nr:protein NODULATION SIGNALING PATHWAY 2 [Cryptomeria japonica]